MDWIPAQLIRPLSTGLVLQRRSTGSGYETGRVNARPARQTWVAFASAETATLPFSDVKHLNGTEKRRFGFICIDNGKMTAQNLLEAPVQPTGSKMRPDYQRAQREALALLDRYSVTEPPIDPVFIARACGVPVTFVNFNGESDQNVSGFFDSETNEIVVNRNEYPLRQTFTVAHELGHKILHEEWTKSEAYRVLLRDLSRTEWDPIEQEANAFAANLLMPRFLMDDFYTLPVERISRLFAVSVPAVKRRLSYLYGI